MSSKRPRKKRRGSEPKKSLEQSTQKPKVNAFTESLWASTRKWSTIWAVLSGEEAESGHPETIEGAESSLSAVRQNTAQNTPQELLSH
jgi:hypothetical protein